MQFLYPQFLFALIAVSIPVAIHLFNFRRFKKIYFSDIRFLKEVKQETRHRNRLKHLLVLLSRILAVSFLVFAFAQPYLPANNKNIQAGQQAISVYVDNSFSMENVSKNGNLFDEAKNAAREIALAHSPTDLFQLLTNDFKGKHQRLVSREDFLALLDEIKISPAVKKFSEVTARQYDALNKADLPRTEGRGTKNKRTFLISDFQKSVSDFQNIKEDSSVKTVLLLVSANQQNNLYIDSCWFESPVHQIGQTEKLYVRIKNHSEQPIENVSIKLFINEQQKSPASFSITSEETKIIPLSFAIKESGFQEGRIEITDYPVTYDDIFYFSFSVEKNISVTCISVAFPPLEKAKGEGGVKPIQSLFGKDSLFILTMQDEKRIDYSALSSQQMIILCELKSISSGLADEVKRFVQNGGSLMVFPPAEMDTSSYKNFLSSLGTNFYLHEDTADTKVDWLNAESEIFSDVFEQPDSEEKKRKAENMDLPIVHSYYTQTRFQRTSEEVLLKIRNGNTFFSKYLFGKGKVYLSAVPLSALWSNLAEHAIFVPLLYKIAFHSQPLQELFYTIGKNIPIEVATKEYPDRYRDEEPFRIRGEDGFEFIPESKMVNEKNVIFENGQIRKAGNYKLVKKKEICKSISFNYDRKESDLSRYTPDELLALCEKNALGNFSLIDSENKNISKVLAELHQGKKLWKWCIALVIFFLAVETLLIRLWK